MYPMVRGVFREDMAAAVLGDTYGNVNISPHSDGDSQLYILLQIFMSPLAGCHPAEPHHSDDH